ncbi:A/G-specific adenine glycosylase [Myxococcota bacterium]|nr:A/G-specific adenine glycosylase [Myxococcota bacterium]
MSPASRPRAPVPPADLLAAARGPEGAALSGALLGWYDAGHRALPWRPERPEERDPYRTWLSEIMLQQTRVEAVKPYFTRFLQRFPTVQALARAPLDEVLGLWAGLGYYSRARNLHAAAQQVAALGAFPDTVSGLRRLPGVGPYVAGAVASIAFGRDEPAVDGNVERVLSRAWAVAAGRAGVEALARAMLPAGRAGDFNQALMDLGSAVCTPRSPRCGACPLRSGCRALATDAVAAFPPPRARRAAPLRQAVGLVVARGGRVLLARRPDQGLFGGLYELPGGFLHPGEPVEEGATRLARERLGLEVGAARRVGQVEHTLTHMQLTLHLVEVAAPAGPVVAEPGAPPLAPEVRPDGYTASAWVFPEQPVEVALSTLTSKALARIQRARDAS